MINEAQVWSSYLGSDKTDQQRVELTSGITNRLLRTGIHNKNGYELEVEILDELFNGLPINEEIRKGFEALKIFVPRVPGELLNRYDAIKHELSSLDLDNLDNLIIGACGLSPLGQVIATKNPGLNVWDTDLAEVVAYRNSQISNKPDKPVNYHVKAWDLLSDSKSFSQNELKKGRTALLVEGLTFYLDDSQMKKFHRNIQNCIADLCNGKPATLIMDYYIADTPARQRDTIVNPQHPLWNPFYNLVSNVYDGQKAFWKSREEVVHCLESQGYKNIRVSPISAEENAHTVFIFEY